MIDFLTPVFNRSAIFPAVNPNKKRTSSRHVFDFLKTDCKLVRPVKNSLLVPFESVLRELQNLPKQLSKNLVDIIFGRERLEI